MTHADSDWNQADRLVEAIDETKLVDAFARPRPPEQIDEAIEAKAEAIRSGGWVR